MPLPVSTSPYTTTPASDEVLVRVKGVSKKFCRSLKQSLWYGVGDIAAELNPFAQRDSAETALDAPARDEDLRPGEFWAVRDISFELRRGECLGLIGHNGAGKTTLLKMLNGLVLPDTGRIELRGRVGALIALGAGFNPILSGRENIYVNGAVLGLSKREIDARFDEIVDFAELRDFIDAPVQSYSSGMAVRLGFAVATALEPDILILDEVLAVGDASFQMKCINAIKRLQSSGVATILVSHDLHNIVRYCNRGLYLSHGRPVTTGDIHGVATRYLTDQAPLSATATAEGESGDVPTESGIHLDRVFCTDLHGNTLSTLPSREPFRLCVPWTISKEPVPAQVRIELAINDNQGLVYQTTSDTIEFPDDNFGRSGLLISEIDGLRLNSGQINIGIKLWANDHKTALAWSRNNFFKVFDKSFQAGRAVIEAQWSITNNCRN